MHAIKSLVLASLCALTINALSPMRAHAQDYGSTGAVGALSTTSYGGATTSSIGTTALVALLMPSSKSSAQLELYLRQNRPQVEQALYLGGGESCQDLAQLFGISAEHYPAFGALLRQHRDALLITIKPDAIRADLFIAQLSSASAQLLTESSR